MKTVNLQIDGKKIFADEGTTILEAARQNGIEIPTLCYHPRLAPLGHCRVCIVDIEGFDKPITSCDNPVKEGMVVVTDTPELREMRDQILVLSLSTHPYKDCLTCERTGSCELQEKAYNFQVELPEQLDRDIPAEKTEDNPYIVRDEEKCILCGRCIQVCRSGPGCFVYSMIGNGVNTRVVPYRDGKEVSLEEAGCIYCGQCVDVCPVAALTETGRAAGGREWELSPTPGVCLDCSLGCSLERQASQDRLIRVTVAEEGEKTSWLCRRGKFGPDENGAEKITGTLAGKNGTFEDVAYEEAVEKTAKSLLDIKNSAGSGAVAVLASGKQSNEESYLLQKLARSILGTPNIDLGVENPWARAYYGAQKVAGPDVYGPSPATMQDCEAIMVIGSGIADSHPVAEMAVQQAGRFGDAVIVRINASGEKKAAWKEISINCDPDKEIDVLEGITAAIEGKDPVPAAEKANLSPELLRAAAEQVTQIKSCTVVGPAFFEGATEKKVDALLSMAKAGGQLEPGRNELLLLSRFSNASGAFTLGGSPAYGPGMQALNGAAGLDREQVVAAAEEGKVKGLLLIGDSLSGAKKGALDFLAVSCLTREDAPEGADILFPYEDALYKRGAFTNSSGYTMFNEPALPGNVEGWKWICDLAAAMGAKWSYSSLEDIREEMQGS